MKKSIFLLLFFASSILSLPVLAQARVNISVQPIWGPVGYNHVDYYYLPDAEVYYSVPQRVYIYEDRGTWVRTSTLPLRFGSVDLYHAYKVVINEPKPYLRHKTYKVKYVSFKGKHDQIVIRDSRDEKYFVVKGHPEHSKWKGSSNSSSKAVKHQEQKHTPSSNQSHGQKKNGGQHKGGGKHKK